MISPLEHDEAFHPSASGLPIPFVERSCLRVYDGFREALFGLVSDSDRHRPIQLPSYD